MKYVNFLGAIIVVLGFLTSCETRESGEGILKKVIVNIDTIETIFYKQDMSRSNPRNPEDTIHRYREMYFERLLNDSVVGVKGHWYMYVNDKENVIYEDIYDGYRLIRKNNRDKVALVYDLIKYPEIKENHFWSHNTPFATQFELKYILSNPNFYSIERFQDTIIRGTNCFQVQISLRDKSTMPGFAAQLMDNKGNVSKTTYFIDQENYFPLGMYGESYHIDDPYQIYFINQVYFDIQLNKPIPEKYFDTSKNSFSDYSIKEIIPE
jgi:hypothetical protein